MNENKPVRNAQAGIRKLPPFEQTIGGILIEAKEAVIAPLRPILREHNITEPQWRVLRVVNDRAPTDATGIAEVCLLHAPSVTRILQDLEARKLVIRTPDPHDRRRSLITLSDEGRAIVKQTSRAMVRILREYAARFGPERFQRLCIEVKALSAAIRGVQ